MVLFWRGWGLAVLWSFVFWFLVGIAWVIVASPHQPDAHKAGLDLQWGIAGLFLAQALSVFALARYRRSHPGHAADHFMFIRFDLWPYILAAIAAFFTVATMLGYLVFEH